MSEHERDGEAGTGRTGPDRSKSDVVLTPWARAVRYRGEDIGGEAPEDPVERGIGYVPQTENVIGSLTVEENLRMGGVTRNEGRLRSLAAALRDGRPPGVALGGDGDELGPVLAELYERFPLLAEMRGAKARTLSGGQRQVLALARALVTEPDVLPVDEPSAGLAPNTADEVFADVETVNELDTAAMMVEQNARKGLSVADRGYVLDQGSVRFEDDALLENEAVVELYLGA